MLKVKPDVLQLKPYTPGKSTTEVQRKPGLKEVVKLASNENPLGPSPKAGSAISEAAANLHRYPDGSGSKLKGALAHKLNIVPDNLILGNGSDEVLELVAKAFIIPGDEVITASVTFVEYEFVSKLNGAKLICLPLREFTYDLPRMAEAITSNTKLIFIANPNNPTGTMVNDVQFGEFMARVPEDVLVVMDEAYFEFVEQESYPDTLEFVRQGRNVMALRTFSKLYGLAGLRIGYGIAAPEVIGYLNRVRQPFNVNSLAQAAALAALEDKEHIAHTLEVISRGRNYLKCELEALGLRCVPSVANFILFDTGRDGNSVYQKLLSEGVIVRTMGIYNLPGFLRVTVGTPQENQLFIKSLGRVLENEK